MCNIMSTDALWVIAKANKVIPEGATPIYAFDNPRFTSLEGGADKTGSQARRGRQPAQAPLPGTCSAWSTRTPRLQGIPEEEVPEGLPAFDCDVECRELCSAFDIVTPGGIATDCQNVQKLVAHIVEMGDGGYAQQRLTQLQLSARNVSARVVSKRCMSAATVFGTAVTRHSDA
jgi:hypothetical protein